MASRIHSKVPEDYDFVPFSPQTVHVYVYSYFWTLRAQFFSSAINIFSSVFRLDNYSDAPMYIYIYIYYDMIYDNIFA